MEQVTIQTTLNGRQIYRLDGIIVGAVMRFSGVIWHIHNIYGYDPRESFNPFDIYGHCCAVRHEMQQNHT